MRLAAERVTVKYGSHLAVDAVDLAIPTGSMLAILGANGSGKSSLLKAIAGILPHSGRVTWDGTAAAPGSIGYMPQDAGVRAGLTAFEVVLLGRIRSLGFRVGAADLEAAEAAMNEIGVSGLSGKRIGELSGGQRQMVLVAQVLAGDPKVLLLDEPTSALDIAHQLHVLDLLRTVTRSRSLTTISVMHDLNAAARFCDSIAIMRAGRLVGIGSPAEMLCRTVLEPTFDVAVAVDHGSDGHPVVLPLRAILRGTTSIGNHQP
jgi:iron complex transport system ATP-binding protein